MESERALKWMLESPGSVLNELDSLDFNNPILPGLFMISNYVENRDTLSESFYSSKYKNKTPIKRALFELNRKRATIFEQATISFFGVQLTFDPWYYLGLLIILILLHDLTRVILFQKSLKAILIRENVEQWQFGIEQTDSFAHSTDATGRFILVISSPLFGIISLSPLASAVLSTKLGPAWEQTSLFLEIVNNFLLFLIVIHTAIIFYTENIFRTKDLVDFLTSKGAKPNNYFYAMWG